MRMDRREFLVRTAAAGVAATGAGSRALAAGRQTPAHEKLNVAVVGVANRGGDNLGEVSRLSTVNIVALCDIDDNYLSATAARFPMAKTYNDYRKMLEQKDIDAVVISTPDHMHAPVTLAAMEVGHDVYCEKPLAHTVAEVRKVTEYARRHKRVTQMGTQIHATSNYRRVVELIQSGAIGNVTEAHSWSDKAWVGVSPLPASGPQPATLHWDLWLGNTPKIPYNSCFVPARWRGWWAYGGGTLADMACHHMDLPFWALKLDHPNTIEAEGPAVSAEIAPETLSVHYEFPALGKRPAVKVNWYHGGKRPPQFAEAGLLPRWGDGTLFVGEKGMLLADYGRYVLLPEKDFTNFTPPAHSIPESIGHHAEWVEACKSRGTTTCNFDYSGPLAETVALGNVAYRVGKKLEWDWRKLRVTNSPEAEPLIGKA